MRMGLRLRGVSYTKTNAAVFPPVKRELARNALIPKTKTKGTSKKNWEIKHGTRISLRKGACLGTGIVGSGGEETEELRGGRDR